MRGTEAADARAHLPLVRIICGPTGAGKSAIAMELAARHGLTIVSADSRQIYRGFDIGTAKPTVKDQSEVRHLGIDVADPGERWSAARWAADAQRWISEVGAERTLVTGGTGLYLRALTSPFFDEPAIDAPRRRRLVAQLDAWPLAQLRDWARRLDPGRAHLGRTQLLRSIEVALLTGKRLSDLHRDSGDASRVRARWLVVDPGTALVSRIESRLDAMLAGGWPDEVMRLERTVPDDAPAWQGCGYTAVREVVRGTLKPAAARETILVHTRQYAKRQRTWFRHQLNDADVTRLDPCAPGATDAAATWWLEGAS